MGQEQIRKSVEILKVDEERQIATGPVLVPGEVDRHGDVVSRENIEDVAYKFMQEYQNIDLMHTFEDVGVPVESFVTPAKMELGGTEVKPGSWLLSVKIEDEETWEGIKSGDLTGFSIYGRGEREPIDEEEVEQYA